MMVRPSGYQLVGLAFYRLGGTSCMHFGNQVRPLASYSSSMAFGAPVRLK